MALLNKPAAPRASVILIPGGDGHVGICPNGMFSRLKGNQLVCTRKAYLAHGVATLTIDAGVSVRLRCSPLSSATGATHGSAAGRRVARRPTLCRSASWRRVDPVRRTYARRRVRASGTGRDLPQVAFCLYSDG